MGIVIGRDLLRHVDRAATSGQVIPIHADDSHCATCVMRRLCLPAGLPAEAMRQLDEAVSHRAKVKKGDSLYRSGQPFTALYAIRVGTFKMMVVTDDGREQITGYSMAGNLAGLDGLGSERYVCQAVALEDSEACVLPFRRLDELAHEMPALRHNLYRSIARDIGRDQNMLLSLGSRSGEERLALFLLELAEAFRERGYSASEFVLRMTREEIASYLGLKLETVSRLFSHLQKEGLIKVQGRAVKLLDPIAMKDLVGSHRSSHHTPTIP